MRSLIVDDKERSVFNALVSIDNICGKDVCKIALVAGINHKTVGRILVDFERMGMFLERDKIVPGD